MAGKNILLETEADWEWEEPDPVDVNIGGTLYEAFCPKDGTMFLLAELEQEAKANTEDVAQQQELVIRMLESVFSEETAQVIFQRIKSAGVDDRRVTLAYVLHVLGKVKDHYSDDMSRNMERLGVGSSNKKVPQDRALPSGKRAAAKKAPAKKAAARGGARKPAVMRNSGGDTEQ